VYKKILASDTIKSIGRLLSTKVCERKKENGGNRKQNAEKRQATKGYKQCGISAEPKSSCIFTMSPKLFGDLNDKEIKEQKFWLIASSKMIAFLPRTAHSRDVSYKIS
jgi:hypothetical protein